MDRKEVLVKERRVVAGERMMRELHSRNLKRIYGRTLEL